MEVEIVVESGSKSADSPNGQIKLARRWTAEGKEEYLVDSKKCGKGQMAGVIECLGLVYSNPYNIVQQGKITQMAAMDDHDIYRLLEETTGVRKYYQKLQ